MGRSWQLLLIGILILCLVWVSFFWSPQQDVAVVSRPVGLAPAPQGGDFVLQSAQGAVALKDLRGKVVVLIFGYTFCPDVCPASLGLLAMALKRLEAEELAQVQGLFVSVDPERDGLEHLKAYVEHFHPAVLGLTGQPEQLREMAGRYGVAYRRVEQAVGGDYSVDHSANTYIIDRQGQLRRTLPYGTPPEELLGALRELL